MRIAMVLLILLVGACSAPSPAPSSSGSSSPATGSYSLRVGDAERTYNVHVPAQSVGKKDVPVVVVLHGGGGWGSQIEQQTGFSDLADQKGFLAVYPNGSGRLKTKVLTWNAGTCCAYARDKNVDDVGFISALVDELVTKFGADPHRIYVTGFSNGAMLAYRLGCELADKIAAIAPVSGAMDMPSCTPSRPLPVYAIHGDADPIVPYKGGTSARKVAGPEVAGTHRSVAYAMQFWTSEDHCASTPARTVHASITSAVYAPCADGTEVRLDTVGGGGHAWPGGSAYRKGAATPTKDLNATSAIWTFFSQH